MITRMNRVDPDGYEQTESVSTLLGYLRRRLKQRQVQVHNKIVM